MAASAQELKRGSECDCIASTTRLLTSQHWYLKWIWSKWRCYGDEREDVWNSRSAKKATVVVAVLAARSSRRCYLDLACNRAVLNRTDIEVKVQRGDVGHPQSRLDRAAEAEHNKEPFKTARAEELGQHNQSCAVATSKTNAPGKWLFAGCRKLPVPTRTRYQWRPLSWLEKPNGWSKCPVGIIAPEG